MLIASVLLSILYICLLICYKLLWIEVKKGTFSKILFFAILPIVIIIGFLVGSTVLNNFTSSYYEHPIKYELFVGNNKTLVYDQEENAYYVFPGYFTADNFFKEDNMLKLTGISKSGHYMLGGYQTFENLRFIFQGKYPGSKYYVTRDVKMEDVKTLK